MAFAASFRPQSARTYISDISYLAPMPIPRTTTSKEQLVIAIVYQFARLPSRFELPSGSHAAWPAS